MIHPTSPTDKKKKKNYINLYFNQSKKVTRKSNPLVHSPCPISVLFPWLSPLQHQIIVTPSSADFTELKNGSEHGRWAFSAGVCVCVCDFAVINCSAWEWVDVPNSHVDISMLLLCSALICVVIDGGHSRRQPHTRRIKHPNPLPSCVSWHSNTVPAVHGACVWSYLLWHNCLYISE